MNSVQRPARCAEAAVPQSVNRCEAQMERVLGIGGFFFRARDPQGLANWYSTNLGVDLTPTDYQQQPWRQQAGPTVFQPFPADTSYFGSPDRMWMLNFRVRDLAAMVAQLEHSGIAVEVDPEEYPNGVFATLRDPEDNPVQLWERRGAAADSPG